MTAKRIPELKFKYCNVCLSELVWDEDKGAHVFPIVEGTECLVVFGDNCMDAWWQSGGVQNQIEKRRHDLSDGYAIIGPRSQVNLIKDYSTDSVQLRNKQGDAVVEIHDTLINVMTSGTVNIGSGDVIINSRVFMNHKHTGVVPGGGNTGGVA